MCFTYLFLNTIITIIYYILFICRKLSQSPQYYYHNDDGDDPEEDILSKQGIVSAHNDNINFKKRVR